MAHIVSHIFGCATPLFSAAPSHGASFELYGLDFMITDDGTLQLLEVSFPPAISPHISPYLPISHRQPPTANLTREPTLRALH